MTDLLAIGTRKGLFLARSDDDRRTWKVDGPHLLAQEVAAVSVDTRRPVPRILAAILYGHWGPTVMWSDDLGVTWEETESGAIRFPEDTGAALARVWQLRPDSADRPDVVWAGCEPHSLWRSTDGGRSFDLVRGLWEHPHRPTWEPGGGGGAVHTILPDPASDRVTVAMSTGGVYVSEDGGGSFEPRNKGITAVFLPGEEPEYGQCVHKVAVDAATPDRMYAQNHFGVFRTDDAGVRWNVDRRRAARRLRLPDRRLSSRARHGVGGPAGRRHAARAARRAPARAPHPRRRRDLDGGRRRSARQCLDGGRPRRVLRRRARPDRRVRRHPRRLPLRQRRRG